jgi:uncharacterized protein YkwD
MKMFCVLLFFTLLATAGQAQAINTGNLSSGATLNKALILQLVNSVRKKGCQCGGEWYGPAPALTWNNRLETAALAHSRDMFQNHYFSHTAPDGSSAGQRIQDAGYEWRTYGENIAAGYTSEQETVQGWLQSPGHCKNIMNKDFREMGVGRAGNYWTQSFATPLKSE